MHEDYFEQLLDQPVRLPSKTTLPPSTYHGPPPQTRVEFIDVHALTVAAAQQPAAPNPTIVLLAAVCGGLLGLDRLLFGRPITGILKLLTFGGAGLWWIWDICMLLAGRYPIAGHPNSRPRGFFKTFSIISIGAVALAVTAAFTVSQLMQPAGGPATTHSAQPQS